MIQSVPSRATSMPDAPPAMLVGSIGCDRPPYGAMSGRMRLASIAMTAGWLWVAFGWVAYMTIG